MTPEEEIAHLKAELQAAWDAVLTGKVQEEFKNSPIVTLCAAVRNRLEEKR